MDALPCARNKAISTTAGAARQHHALYAMRDTRRGRHKASSAHGCTAMCEAQGHQRNSMHGATTSCEELGEAGTRPSARRPAPLRVGRRNAAHLQRIGRRIAAHSPRDKVCDVELDAAATRGDAQGP
ncbi:hypothetical protein HAX54_007884 [Datura stramonium]|uniref:Uncharacterized protein n=1 Tax=Datura stramonium TaxID=4076 RepID=A0ABS8TCD1_DATST|nr:hypothetical protein [Datura stramonium]